MKLRYKMKVLLLFVLLLAGCLLLGCASWEVDQSRAGCSFLDGKARYGTFTQYAKGKAEGAHIYIGDKIKDKVKITCSETKQEIRYNGGAQTEELEKPEWARVE